VFEQPVRRASLAAIVVVLVSICALCFLAYRRHAAAEQDLAARSECVREYHFLHTYIEFVRSLTDLTEVNHVSDAAFGVADGKARDALRIFDDLGTTPSERALVVGASLQLEAEEHCNRVALRACSEEVDRTTEKAVEEFHAISDTIGACDRFNLPLR
jgi:hypothetical protein